VVAEPEVSDGEGEPLVPPVVELELAPAPASVGVFTWPAAPPEVSEVVPLDVEGMVDDVEGVVIEPVAPVVPVAPVDPVAPIDPLMVPLLLVVDAVLALAPVVAAMLAPDHQSREARSLGEAARYSSSMA
jgi:hypothetical protein